MVFAKPLRVGKLERYEVDANYWLNGEVLVSATVEPDDKATLTGSVSLDGGVIGFYLTGAAKGGCKIHLNYATATRNDCFTVVVNVLLC